MNDIENKKDVKEMVEGFYALVKKDPLLGPVFNEVAGVDWSTHLPLMIDFWSSLLFGTGEYKGQPFPKHARLPLTPAHFDRWISLFDRNLKARFKGRTADQAKQQATQIAKVFAFKYHQLRHHCN